MFQIAAVNMALGAGAYMVNNAFRVVYDKDMETNEDLSYMLHKPTKRAFRFRREKNVWILDAAVAAESVFGDFSRPERMRAQHIEHFMNYAGNLCENQIYTIF